MKSLAKKKAGIAAIQLTIVIRIKTMEIVILNLVLLGRKVELNVFNG